MKIAFIISSLGSGGAERVLSLLANYFSDKNKVIILTLSSDESFYPLNKNIQHIKLNLIKESKNIFDSFVNSVNRIFILKKVLKEIDADINISFMTHTNILAIIASKITKKKIIISERIAYDFYNSDILNFIRRLTYPLSDFLVVQTHADKKHYNYLKNIEVIYNPLNLKTNNLKKENIILAVGRLDKQKGFDNLIKAYSKLKTDWKLFIAGDGQEKKNLDNLIKKLNLKDNIFLIGNQENIFEWYAKASIFVLSSQKEGFPNVLIEAMSMGCSVVSFDCPYGPGEIIENNINGILVENQNIDKLALSIQRLIDNKDLREKLSKEAIRVREKYSIEKIANKWEKVMQKVING